IRDPLVTGVQTCALPILTLVPNPFVYTAGLWLTDLWAPAFALFLLSYPTGRLSSRADLAIVAVFLFVTVPLEFLWFLFLVLDSRSEERRVGKECSCRRSR